MAIRSPDVVPGWPSCSSVTDLDQRPGAERHVIEPFRPAWWRSLDPQAAAGPVTELRTAPASGYDLRLFRLHEIPASFGCAGHVDEPKRFNPAQLTNLRRSHHDEDGGLLCFFRPIPTAW